MGSVKRTVVPSAAWPVAPPAGPPASANPRPRPKTPKDARIQREVRIPFPSLTYGRSAEKTACQSVSTVAAESHEGTLTANGGNCDRGRRRGRRRIVRALSSQGAKQVGRPDMFFLPGLRVAASSPRTHGLEHAFAQEAKIGPHQQPLRAATRPSEQLVRLHPAADSHKLAGGPGLGDHRVDRLLDFGLAGPAGVAPRRRQI